MCSCRQPCPLAQLFFFFKSYHDKIPTDLTSTNRLTTVQQPIEHSLFPYVFMEFVPIYKKRSEHYLVVPSMLLLWWVSANVDRNSSAGQGNTLTFIFPSRHNDTIKIKTKKVHTKTCILQGFLLNNRLTTFYQVSGRIKKINACYRSWCCCYWYTKHASVAAAAIFICLLICTIVYRYMPTTTDPIYVLHKINLFGFIIAT